MAITRTQKGRYFVIVSDASAVSDAVIELVEYMNNNQVPMSNVIWIDPSNKLAVYHL